MSDTTPHTSSHPRMLALNTIMLLSARRRKDEKSKWFPSENLQVLYHSCLRK